jgi:hypothetical protein
MINQWIIRYRKNSFVESHRFLLVYAHIIGLIHGIGFLLQGTTKLVGPIKYALQQNDAWHGGLPAISIFDISFVAGIFVILLSSISLGLIFYKLKPNLIILWILVFLSGGGFVFLIINLISAISLFVLRLKNPPHDTVIGKSLMAILIAWLFISWALGWMFPVLMYGLSHILFIVFDIGIPMMIVIIHRKNFRLIR